jgi:3-(3-hydroxy-phenyl)propionate hydroxylase
MSFQNASMDVDVIIAGCGPVGALAGNLLGRMGVRTLIVERELAPHGQPRAFSCDDEGMRIYQAAGLVEQLRKDMYQGRFVDYVGGSGERFAELHPGEVNFGFGYTPLWFFHQPLLEKTLREGLRRFAHVELRLGVAVEALEQDAEGVTVRCREVASGEVRTVRARYLLGCDGGRSKVRQLLDIALDGRSSPEPWLAVSGTIEGEAPELCRFVCDPKRPAFVAVGAARQFRWEFMVLPGETREQMEHPDTVNKLIAPYIDPKRVSISRAQVYTFHRLMASRWRQGRAFLLGDAAHMMPPFMGQGLCSGLRDAANLTWKLQRVLAGLADDALLDTYEQERRPHVEAMMELSVRMGHLFLARNGVVAAARDAFMRGLQRIPSVRRFIQGFGFKPMPAHEEGFYLGGGRSGRDAPEGGYFIQPPVRLASGEEVLLDEAVGTNFVVLSRAGAKGAEVARKLARKLGARFLRFTSQPEAGGEAEAGEPGEAPVVDVTGKLSEWFARHAADVVVLRPDRFVFGAVPAERLPELSAALGV